MNSESSPHSDGSLAGADQEPDWYARLPREIRVLLAEVPAAMAYIDRNQRYRYTNMRFRRWVASEYPEGVIGMQVAQVSGERYQFIRPSIERALSGRASSHEELILAPDGKPCWLRTTLVPDMQAGEVCGYVLLTTDITRSKQAEQALADERQRYAEQLERQIAERTTQLRELQARLVDAERLSAAEQMAGAVAHAINNPLTALIGVTEMAQQHMLESATALQRVRLLARRIEEVVQSTLWMYRQGQVDLCEECPEALVNWVKLEVSERARARDIDIRIRVAAALPKIVADRTLLCSAIGCVVENAVQASGDGSAIWIDAEPIHDRKVIRISVLDDGPGIPQELREKVLEPFFTTKSGGTGFGLAIASAVVQGHGGSLRILERTEGGTRVEIDLLTARGGARASTSVTSFAAMTKATALSV